MLYMLISVILFLISNIFVKGAPEIPFYNWVFYRGVFILICSGAYLRFRGLSLFGINRRLLLLRGALGTLGIILFLYTVQALPLGVAITLQYTSPIFTILFSGVFLNEWPRPLQWLFFILALVGVVILKGGAGTLSYFPLIVGLIAASISGFAYTTVRALGKTDHPVVVMIYFTYVTVPVTLPAVLWGGYVPRIIDFKAILLFCLCNLFAQIFLTLAYQKNRAHRVGIINYVGVVISFFIGFFVFDEAPSGLSMLGVAFILGALLLNGWISSKVKD